MYVFNNLVTLLRFTQDVTGGTAGMVPQAPRDNQGDQGHQEPQEWRERQVKNDVHLTNGSSANVV